MKFYDEKKTLGWKAKIGVIAPTENTITEPEFNMMRPSGVTVHFTRMPIHFKPKEDNYKGLMNDLELRLIELKDCGVDVVTYNCTVGSMACPNDLLINKLQNVSGVSAVTTASSIVDALHALNVSKIALATPYSHTTNYHEKTYLSERGIKVVAMKGMNFKETGRALGRRFGNVTPLEIFNHALSTDHIEAEAILISCANFGSAQIVDKLEKKIKKPVITSNTATFWASLRIANIKDKVEGFGQLLSQNEERRKNTR